MKLLLAIVNRPLLDLPVSALPLQRRSNEHPLLLCSPGLNITTCQLPEPQDNLSGDISLRFV
jgi:hypothetical protein